MSTTGLPGCAVIHRARSDVEIGLRRLDLRAVLRQDDRHDGDECDHDGHGDHDLGRATRAPGRAAASTSAAATPIAMHDSSAMR